MNKMLMSSVMGSEFINYRKKTGYSHRNTFSNGVRSSGEGMIPIVVDSVDYGLSIKLSENNENIRVNRSYGKEYIMHIDTTVEQFLDQINEDIKEKTDKTFKENIYILGLEDGSLADKKLTLGYIYKNHKYKKDNILYMLLSKEVTMYGYIMSIIRYVLTKIYK
jgi:hypothetical protein